SVANPTPTIAQGDRTDDATKFNLDFYAANEGSPANKIKFGYSNLDISVVNKRVIAEWTDELADDASSVYDDDAERALMDHMSQEMSRVVDRDLIGAVLANIPSANTYTWTQTPDGTAGSINYSTSSASDRRVYDETLFSDGIQTTINKIRITRKYNNDGDPNWLICDPLFSLALMKSTAFKPVDNLREMQLLTGALRDFGTLTSNGIRVLVDPLMTAKTAVLGRKPTAKGDPAIYWAPYVNLQPTRDLYDPETGTTTKGVRNRYAIAKPNAGSNAASSQLAEVYGKLTIV
ncbi:MAG: Major capsid protein Gp23, partial [Mucilaginibacter sp.]|nr:Major capsid protein Gp23 [Mucilaginibacter sp.]